MLHLLPPRFATPAAAPLWLLLLLLSLLACHAQAIDFQVSGNISAEGRYFEDSGARAGLRQSNLALSAEPEFYFTQANSKDSFLFTPFLRWDENDARRSHLDIRELKWHKVEQNWELTLGVNRVFWGVTETVHLVNIINQVDLVENLDQEDLLGQPMANLALVRDWGTLDLFVMPYFRERRYHGRLGRPGANLPVSDSAQYESSAKEWRTDAALRWSQSLGAFDVGLSHFYGTSREPRFSASLTLPNARGEIEFVPLYEVINQTGIDAQGTFGAWLLKLEAISRAGQQQRFFASASGFEYSFYSVAGSALDLGVVLEYLFDERETSATDNDLSLGLRVALNDINSSEFLAAIVQDLDNRSRFFFIEASRRIGNTFKLSFEARGTSGVASTDPLIQLDDDNYLQIEIGRYF